MRTLTGAYAACLVVFGWQLVLGQGDMTAPKADAGLDSSVADFSTDGLFEHGRYEANFSSGVLFSPFLAIGQRPTINYTMTEVQIGYMLTDVRGRNWWRGNFEAAGEGFASWIYQGEGSFIAGGTIWGRYNFVQPGARLVPFGQIGLGMVSTDINRRIVGQPFNFNIEVGLGTRYLLSEHWGLNLEFRYQHISNANTGVHNLGINSYGPILGISYLF